MPTSHTFPIKSVTFAVAKTSTQTADMLIVEQKPRAQRRPEVSAIPPPRIQPNKPPTDDAILKAASHGADITAWPSKIYPKSFRNWGAASSEPATYVL